MKEKLVLVPGLGGDEGLWFFQIKHLSDIANIVVPDLSECGSRADMADKILASVPGQFALAGVSMGGWVGFKVAAQAPERITKFAAIGTWARMASGAENTQRKILKQIKDGSLDEFLESNLTYAISLRRRNDKKFVGFLKNATSQMKADVMIRHLEATMNDFDSSDLLPKIKCPTLVIAGRDDLIFSVEEHEYIAESIDGARLAIVDDSGHILPFERPQALSALLRYWLMYFSV